MSKKLIEDSKENIELINKLYNEESMNMERIAEIFNVSVSIISRFMKRNNIKSRISRDTRLLRFSKKDIQDIIKYYIEDNLSTDQISKFYNVDRKTISNYLKRNGIIPQDICKTKITEKEQNRRNSMIKLEISDEKLINLYCNQKLNAEDIARIYNVSRGAVLPRLRKLNIDIRSLKQILEENKEYRLLHIKRMQNNQTEETDKKRKITNLKRYGVDNPFKSIIFQTKANVTKYRNGSQKTSFQQEYLNKILKGELNYLYSRSYLDIAFPNEMIYIEYNGGGHDLSVQLNSISKEDFDKKENKRSFYLRSKGWKEVRIISLKDKIPSNNKILEIFDLAKEYLNQGHHYIKFDLDNSKIINSQGKFDYDFGELRRIKNEDLKEVS